MTVDKELKEVFSNLVTHSENLELDLQEDNFTERFGMQYMKFTNEDLMKLEAQKKEEERQEEDVITEKQENHDAGNGKGIFSFFFSFIFISWRLITLQYCSGFCHN